MSFPNEIHIALCFDKNFLTPFYVLITSIFENNTTNSTIIFHAITSSVDNEDKSLIIEYINKNKGEINFYSISDEYIKSIIPPGEVRYGTAAYYRLFFPDILPSIITRYLYLDIDMIVVNSLAELFNTDFDPAPIAAVSDQVVWPRNGRGMGYFFNTGVLLVNRKLWQEQELTKRCINFMRNYPELINYADQDALNGVVEDNWYELKEKYNFTFRCVPALPHSEYGKLLKDVVIVHYNESVKPWHRLNRNRLGYLYKEYFSKSPQPNKKLYHKFVWSKKNVTEFFSLRISNAYLNSPAIVSLWRKVKSKPNH
jgi:lipopolysaccharide biosynthesis glycosyltransferase